MIQYVSAYKLIEHICKKRAEKTQQQNLEAKSDNL